MAWALIHKAPFRVVSACAPCRSGSVIWGESFTSRALLGKELTFSRRFPSASRLIREKMMLKNKNIAAQEKQDASSTLYSPLHIKPEQAVRQKSVASIYQHMVRDSATVSPYDIRGLQSTVGNQAIQRLLAAPAQP